MPRLGPLTTHHRAHGYLRYSAPPVCKLTSDLARVRVELDRTAKLMDLFYGQSIPPRSNWFSKLPCPKTSPTTGRLTRGHARVSAGHRSGVRACKEVHDFHQLGPVRCRGTGKTGGRLSIYQCPPWSLSKKFYTKKSCLHCSQCVHVLSHC
jgi:hypothetical protein